MKKLLFAITFLCSIGAALAQPHLAIGDRIDQSIDYLSAWIGTSTQQGTIPVVQDWTPYSASMGDAAIVASNLLMRVARDFKPPSGQETEQFRVYVEAVGSVQGVAGYIIKNDVHSVTLERNGNQWVIPAKALQVNFKYQSYLAYWVEGVTSVNFLARWPAGNVWDLDARNGVYDETCSLYDRTDGVLWFTSWFATREMNITGTVTLYFNNGKAEYNRYDLETGNLVESTKKSPSIAFIGRDQVELMVWGGRGTNRIEMSDDLKSWREIAVFPATLAPQKKILPRGSKSQAFYRARGE